MWSIYLYYIYNKYLFAKWGLAFKKTCILHPYNVLPKLSNNLNNLHRAIDDLNTKSNQDEQFLFINDHEKIIVVFQHKKM